MSNTPTQSAWLKLFLPFAAGYFLSYLFRTVNAVIGPVLARELDLADNALGLLTSTYFLAFGAAQLPLGMLLDRYGPRRVESGLLLLAGAGVAIFAMSDTLGGLAIGRALIGLGVSACLMASFKAFALWFPPERQASLTGWVMAASSSAFFFISAAFFGSIFSMYCLASSIDASSGLMPRSICAFIEPS